MKIIQTLCLKFETTQTWSCKCRSTHGWHDKSLSKSSVACVPTSYADTPRLPNALAANKQPVVVSAPTL
jgi:hypothetical protein